MDACLTRLSAFLHRLAAARQLSIKHAASCDPRGAEHRASKEQHPGAPGPETNQNQTPAQQKTPDQPTVGAPPLCPDVWFPPSEPHRVFSSSPPDISAGMQCVRCPAILALVALVLCGPGVSSQLDRDQDQNQDLNLELHQHRLLQRARSAGLLSQVRAPTANQNAPFLLSCLV